MKKDIVNQFSVSGFIGQDATVRSFEKSSVARFSLAVSKGEKDKGGKTQYTSAFVAIEAWRKNENLASFDLLKKGQMLTVNGYFKPEQWTAEDGTVKNRVILVAVKFFATPDKEETLEKG